MKQQYLLLTLYIGLITATISAEKNYCTFNHFTVFGDSYSDIGNANPIPNPYCLAAENPPYAPATNPGALLWDQVVAAALCVPFTPSKDGGTDYAVSLATSAQVLAQVQAYTKSPNAPLCNNLFAIEPSFVDFALGLFVPPLMQVVPPIAPVVDNVVNTVNTLSDAGASYIIASNMTNLSLLPVVSFFRDIDYGNQGPVAQQTTTLFNEQVRIALNALCTDVIQLDFFGLQEEVFADPAAYGFTQLVVPCCCPAPNFCAVDNPDCTGSFFWDFGNLAGRAHKLFGDYTVSVLCAPQQFAQLGQAALGSIFAHNFALQHYLTIPEYTYTSGKRPYFFVTGGYAPRVLGVKPSYCCQTLNNQSFDIIGGLLYPIREDVYIGGSYGYTRSSSKHDHGDNHINMNTFSFFGNFHKEHYYINFLLNGGPLNNSMSRCVQLLDTRRTARGSSSGSQVGINSAGVYYLLNRNHIQFGPCVDLEYNRIKIGGYEECGAGSANIYYNTHILNSVITGIGLQAQWDHSYSGGDFTANINLLANKDWKNNNQDIYFHVASIEGSHGKLPVCVPHSAFAVLNVHTQFISTRDVTFTLGYQGRFGGDDLNNQVVNFGIGKSF